MEASHEFDNSTPVKTTAPGKPVYQNNAVMLGAETDAYKALLNRHSPSGLPLDFKIA